MMTVSDHFTSIEFREPKRTTRAQGALQNGPNSHPPPQQPVSGISVVLSWRLQILACEAYLPFGGGG